MKYATLLVLGAFQAAFAHIDEFLQTGVAPPYQHGDSDAVKMTPPPLVDCRGGPIGVHFGATVDVTNNIPHGVSVRAIAFAKDGSKRVCDGVEGWSKPHFRVAVDDSVEYVMFVPLPSAAWDVEVWRTKSGQWPTAFTLNGPSEAKLDVSDEPKSCTKKLQQLCGHCGTNKNCWVQCAKSHEGQLLAAGCKKPSSADAVAQTEGFVAHQVDAPDHDHCEEIMIPGTHEGQLFWKTMSWKFDTMKTGSCPSKYNWVNKNVESFEGFEGVVYREYGMHKQKKTLRGSRTFQQGSTRVQSDDEVAAPLQLAKPVKYDDVVQCTSGTTSGHKIQVDSVVNMVAPSLKLRTCSVAVDPKTGWACNHGTNFVDCGRHLKMSESATLELDDDVKSILPITFTAQGSVDKVSRCYMKKPIGGWGRVGGVMTLDQKWWDDLQTSC